jgi:hypothetical protein
MLLVLAFAAALLGHLATLTNSSSSSTIGFVAGAPPELLFGEEAVQMQVVYAEAVQATVLGSAAAKVPGPAMQSAAAGGSPAEAGVGQAGASEAAAAAATAAAAARNNQAAEISAGALKAAAAAARSNQAAEISAGHLPISQPNTSHHGIDVVYLWVNGSDPKHHRSMMQHAPKEVYHHSRPDVLESAANQARYNADRDELRFSVRSLQQYMPWFRHLYIVTNGQVPQWLDVDNPRVTGAQNLLFELTLNSESDFVSSMVVCGTRLVWCLWDVWELCGAAVA